MSPELKSEIIPDETEVLVADLRKLFESTHLEPDVVIEIPLPKLAEQSLASTADRLGGIYQDLRAVIKSDEELFFVIDAVVRTDDEGSRRRRPEYAVSTLISKHLPGQKSEIVGFHRNRGAIDIGSDPIGQIDLSVRSPKCQFSVAQAVDGSIGVIGHESARKIEVFTQKTTDDPNQLSPVRSDHWIVDPATLCAAVESSLSKN